ncbi:MAG: beta strand repeat-containing protein [Acidobacteriota bacterium]
MKTFILACVLAAAALAAHAQSPSTTTVQGTVYNAAGAPISGTLQLTWPAFTTSASQAIAAGRLTATIGADGFLSVNLAPNMGATPAGLYYTAVYHLADGTTSTEYWVVPAAPQATLAAVRAQVMPAAQAVQAVNKAYVDQAIQQYATNQVSTFGGTLSGPLYLNGDPLIPTQAANKHYVDNLFAQSLSSAGGIANGPITATQLGAVYQADQASGTDFTSKLQACINGLNATYGGTCDARNFTGSLSLTAPITIATANVTVQLPCATIATAYPIVVPPGTRNVTLHGCATRGTSSASGSQGGTVFLFSGSAALFQIGDSTYAADTSGFHLDNVAINTTAASAATAQALAAWRAQELQLTSLYLLGNSNQTALTLDGTGNYTGGTFQDIQIGGYLTAVNAIGHKISNPATTDWLNAGAFVRLHINCPTSGGNPIAGTTGINLQQGDGNTFTGGDIEGCSTALHLGANAQNNTILGLRNENSTSQVVADPGSSYNNWITGGTMFTGKLTDNGTRNSFLDTFHRSFNALNGDWYGSQQDTTVTNHFRLGIGAGTERGLLNRYQTDYGYRWTMGLTDAAAGEQFYQLLDELNNVNRISIGQYNNGQPSTNNQTVLNSAGTGAIVLNGSNNAGTGGVVIGSGGATSSTVATIDKSGNANFTGGLQVGGTSQSSGPITVRNNADAEVDYFLWPGATTSQKGSFVYRDYNGTSQWYLVKDQSNNWALNSAIGGLDSFKAYQSTNSGDTYVNASNSSGAVRINYESGSGSAFNIYGGNSSTLYAGFTGPAAIKFPGLAASTGHNCVQIDNSGWITNTGSACGTGTVGAGSAGQVAWYSASGTAVTGMAAVPLSAGGTGASDAPTALANLGAVPASGGTMTGPLTGTTASFSGDIAAANTVTGVTNQTKTGSGQGINVMAAGAYCDDIHNDAPAIQSLITSLTNGGIVIFPTNALCKTTDPINITTPNIIFRGGASRQFITGNAPTAYIDFQGTNANAINVQAQGFVMEDMAIKYPTNTGASLNCGTPALSQTTGGTLTPLATYHVEANCVNAQGQTIYSTDTSITLTGSNNAIVVARPSSSGGGDSATGWNVAASLNAGNEVVINPSTLAWNTLTYTITSIVNHGYRVLVDTTANCAVFDNNAGKYHHVFLFTAAQSSGPPFAVADGFCFYGSSVQVDRGSQITGFDVGIKLEISNNLNIIKDNFLQANRIGLVIGGGAKIDVRNNDFEGNLSGDIWYLSGQATISSYFEQQTRTGITNYNIQFGAAPGSSQYEMLVNQNGAYPPQNAKITDSYMNCNRTSAVDPIQIQQVSGLLFENNNIVNCGTVGAIINNVYANPGAYIRMSNNLSSNNLAAWITSTTGVTDRDYSLMAYQLGPRIISTINPTGLVTTTYGGTGQNWSSSSGIPSFNAGTASLYDASCSGNSNALTWNSSTQSFGCNTILSTAVAQPFIVTSTFGTTVVAGATSYLAVYTWSASQVNGWYIAPRAGTLENFYLTTSSAQNAGGSMVCTVQVGGNNTSITVTVPAGASGQVWSDTSDTATVTAGAKVGVACVNNSSGGASAGITGVSLGLL